jgi:hypothetical protein
MTPNDIELAKEAVKQILEPVKDFMEKLLGPAATEIGLSLGDSLRVWRLKRAVRLVQDVEQALLDAGLNLKPVAPRLLFPILEAASLQDEEDMHQRWVALLTNAARTDYDEEVLPSFPDILKQLTSAEAQFLDRAYDAVENEEQERLQRGLPHIGDIPMLDVPVNGETVASVSRVHLTNIQRLGLLTAKVRFGYGGGETDIFSAPNPVHLTEFDKAFVRVCRLPKYPGSRVD